MNLTLTPVEKKAVAGTHLDVLYPPEEKIPTVMIDNFPALGRLAAMRFIEWVQANPGGVISLPTGKTPEHFIHWVKKLTSTWNTRETKSRLEEAGIDPSARPDLKSLHFVQIDEFYPINPVQHNSFFYYVNKFYVDGFGLDRSKALLMDCSRIGLDAGQRLEDVWPDMKVDLSLRVRPAAGRREQVQRTVLARIDQWCQEYEDAIRKLGGIGFFLGGIGPDGHIGFNIRGSDHHSTTRLCETNYETQAAAATDLGGIEISRNRLVITIGLGTITHNPACTALIIAAGEAKAAVTGMAIQSAPDVLVPASALQRLPGARFYITAGAGKLLRRRQQHIIAAAAPLPAAKAASVVIDCALRVHKRVLDVTGDDLNQTPEGQAVRERCGAELDRIKHDVHDTLVRGVENGMNLRMNKRFLHTEPHHDDIMLGYLPAAVRHVRPKENIHYFATLTSGFTAVTNQFMHDKLDLLRRYIDTDRFRRLADESYFNPANIEARNRDIWQYLDGIAAQDATLSDEGAARRLLRNLIEIFDETGLDNIKNRITELMHYFESEYPGKKDLDHIQRLKGMCREWEAECLWGYFGWESRNVRHLRLGFYTGDIFTKEPEAGRDVPPVMELLREVSPDIVTVALDPEASGPDTHYKVLQAVTEALRVYRKESGGKDIAVWGYRNVWYRFHPAEANLFVPVSLNMFSVMESAFMNTFISQKAASFPSHEHDGPFCRLSQKIQTEQYLMLKTCLGREWFYEHPSPLIRATRGFVFLKEMTLDELLEHSRDLKQVTENA